MSEPPGLQRERTVLAWDRTGLAVLVLGLLTVRLAGRPYFRLVHLAGLAVAAAGALLVVLARVRYQQLQRAGERSVPAAVGVAGATAVVVAGGIVALALILGRW